MQIELTQVKVRRVGDQVQLDGKAHNVGTVTLHGAKLLFYFDSSDKSVVSKREATLDAKILEPGEDVEFQLEMPFPTRAVRVRIQAEDKKEHWIDVANGGPFPIE